MDENELLEALRAVFLDQLKELYLPVQPGKSWDEESSRTPGVFLHQLPERTGDGPGLADRRAPYVLLQVLTAQDDRDEAGPYCEYVVQALIATYAEDAATATQALVNVQARLRLYLLRHPVFGRHFRVLALSRSIYPEDKTTFATGSMLLTVRGPGVEPETDMMHMPKPGQQPTSGGVRFGW